MKKTFLILFATFVATCLCAQNYQKGYIVTNENETIRGYIDFRTDEVNCKQCTFKKELNAQPEIYYPEDIQTYRFDDGKYYVSRNVKIGDTESTVFLEFLVEGIMNLYYYTNNNQKYYFFEDEKGEMTLYTQRPDRINDENQVVTDYKYRNLIQYYFRDNKTIMKKAVNMKFNQKSFIDVAKQYHQDVCTSGEDCIVYVNKKPDESSIKLNFSLYAGIQQSTYIFDVAGAVGYNIDSKKHTSKNIAPVIGAQVDIMNPRWSKYFSIQAGLQLSQFKKKTPEIEIQKNISSIYYYSFDYKGITISPKLGVKYTYPEYRLRPSISAGVLYTIFANPSFEQTISQNNGLNPIISDYKMRKTHLGYYISLGIDYEVKTAGSIFIRASLENYTKSDASQFHGKDKIKTPNIVLGYTF
ncbi:outer membrane beta-barrel protein [Dysgonomonas sp. 25]|uniref:outer membrane beta-barrel protein n=1 Tax=Dysgonomonas sp. 25 TaxID=2302933 RepID=UPI0013D06C23|nr:outer membrane beta-barrel protein [Dysgonomonas sp. 25]NDV68438.1 hypothetical protein [Dysgonomonas sp. 25]